MLDTSKVLFVDTEHNEETYAPESIQLLYNGEYLEFTSFTSEAEVKITEYWNKAEAIIMWNAPFDMGKISAMFGNFYKWHTDTSGEIETSSWKMNIFHNNYKVRRIGGFRNLIKTENRDKRTRSHKEKGVKSTPVVDLLKLWSILIESGDEGESLKLKDVLKRHNYDKPIIKYSKQAAQTVEYRKQDVEGLEYLTKIFLTKVERILDLKSYSWLEWSEIKSPATFTKAAYARRYPLKDYQKANDIRLSQDDKLSYALEQAYNGGITLSLHRGTIHNTAWVDIKSAYANTIKHENTDRFLLFDFKHYDGDEWDYKKLNCLLRVKVNFVIQSINKSLKLFALDKMSTRYVWYRDIEACSNLYPDFKYEVLDGWEFIPLCPAPMSLVEEWVQHKENDDNGDLKHTNPTLYAYYKFLSNTSYGIKAQRKPFRTIHTNMSIAGMITSNVHRILSEIVKTVQDFGHVPKYSDTDSCCFAQSHKFTNADMDEILNEINRRIYPYMVDGEGYNKDTTFLSLKRYISLNGDGKGNKDKIRLHGKGRYKVSQAELKEYVLNKKCEDRNIFLINFAGNTQRTLDQIIKRYPHLEHYHPFMFKEGVETDRTLLEFMVKWYTHMDTKAYPFHGDPDDNFSRSFHKFTDGINAEEFFKRHVKEEENDSYNGISDDVNNTYRSYDSELEEDFNL